MQTVQVPLDLVLQVISLADGFGTPVFSVVEADEDDEASDLLVMGADLTFSARFTSKQRAQAEQLCELLTLLTWDVERLLTEEQRKKFQRDRTGPIGT